MACPPPSPPPLECICEKPVVCGDRFFSFPGEALVGAGVCAIPLYLLPISLSHILQLELSPNSDVRSEVLCMGRRIGVAEITHRYFINTSKTSVPPSEAYILLSIGDISACFIDCSISMTVARCVSYAHIKISIVSLIRTILHNTYPASPSGHRTGYPLSIPLLLLRLPSRSPPV